MSLGSVCDVISALYFPDSMVPPTLPHDKSHFRLDIAGLVGGLLGADDMASAIVILNIFGRQGWLGWQNSPGSYEISRRFALLAESRFTDCFSPGVHTDPTTLLRSGACQNGPEFRAAHSSTVIEKTGPFAALITQECAALQAKVVQGRKTQATAVTVVELNDTLPPYIFRSRATTHSPVVLSLPITISICSCIACFVVADWFAFWSIFLGIFASGVSSLLMSSGKLMFTYPDSAHGSLPGDGILISGQEIVVLKGEEGAVNCATRGSLSLHFSDEFLYENIGRCTFLFTMQFAAQLLLVPQCSLFGQIMFSTSLGASAICNTWASSDKKRIQQDILLDNILESPVLKKYSFARTTMVVFVLLVLQPGEPEKILDKLLPNDGKVRRKWKETIVSRLVNKDNFKFVPADWELDGFSEEERAILMAWYGDAEAAYDTYVEYLVSK